jgi:hypothetical protein
MKLQSFNSEENVNFIFIFYTIFCLSPATVQYLYFGKRCFISLKLTALSQAFDEYFRCVKFFIRSTNIFL